MASWNRLSAGSLDQDSEPCRGAQIFPKGLAAVTCYLVRGLEVVPTAIITDRQHAPAFISSSRPAAYREMLCRASRYAPDLGPALLEVKEE